MPNNQNMLMGVNPTITEYIDDYNSEDLISSAYFLKQVLTSSNSRKMLVNFSNLVVKYLPELNAIKTKVNLSPQEYAKYKYNPKLMSFDLYGTTELWFMILEANELHSVAEFDLRTVNLFRADVVDKIIRILNLESETKNYNEEEISEALLS